MHSDKVFATICVTATIATIGLCGYAYGLYSASKNEYDNEYDSEAGE